MSYSRPTFDELFARIAADLANVPAVLRDPLSAAWARACHGQHGHLEWVLAQCSPLTCDLERLYDWAALYGVPRLDATKARGSLVVGGTLGATVLSGAAWRAVNGLDYVVSSAVTLTDATALVDVVCATAGAAGNLSAGQSLTLVDPAAGVTGTATVWTVGMSGGADIESLDAWRIRVADEWQTMVVMGGRAGRPADYRYWATAAHPSVTGALVQPNALGYGTVLVRPICGALDGRLPTAAVMSSVLDYLVAHAPAGADPRVTAPVLRSVSIQVHIPAAVDSAVNRAAIRAAVQALVSSEVSELAVLSLAEIDAAVVGVVDSATRVAPSADVVCAPGEILSAPTLAWV